MKRVVFVAVCLVLAVLTGAAPRAAKEYAAERFDVTGVVHPDGSFEVTERIAFRFSGGEFTEVTRELPTRETDGVDVLEASIDGRVLPEGEAAGQVEVRRSGSRSRVIFRFEPARDVVRVFTLRYRYAGVVRYGEGEDWFVWRPYPGDFDYPIEAGEVRVTWPDDVRARRQPDVEGAAASTTPLDQGFALTVANYRQRDDDVRMTVRFEAGGFKGAEPQWQRDARRADRLAPAFFAAAAMIAAATALALWLFFLRFKRDPVERVRPESITGPPDDLPPALAGAIASGRVATGGAQLLGAVFDLARRGVVKIEERAAAGALKKRAFMFTRGTESSLRPHERAVLAALFKDGQAEAPFAKALRHLSGRAGKIGTVVTGELAEAGFIDRERRDGGRALTIAGLVVMAFSAVLAVAAAAMAVDSLGGASILVPAAFAMSGLVMTITGAAFSTLSRSGASAARRWNAYGKRIKAQAKQGHVPADGEAIGRVLPYAAALGVLSPFGKALEKTETRHVPPWLRTLDAAGGPAGHGSHGAMIAMLTAASSSMPHSSGGGAGGAGGGGGVGGGSSGAR